MAPARKRENRENQFYNVGEQGRKTGITLEDKGLRDEYGMEPVSGIFSSPEKSPPKRGTSARRRTGGTVIESESMDIQESTIPDLTPGHILRNNRTNLPPPRSRSPMKTALGSSPRRQSMAPQTQSLNRSSSPNRTSSRLAVSRRLDFDQEDASLQETPALSGSGARRGGKARRDVYEMELSPVPTYTTILDESLVQEEITANEDANMFDGIGGDSFAGLEEDTMAAADIVDDSMDAEESEVVEEAVIKTVKRGRKRKSDALEAVVDKNSPAPLPKKGRTATAKASAAAKGKRAPQPAKSNPPARAAKPKRFSEITEEDLSIEEVHPTDESMVEEEEQPRKAPAKGRGRRPKAPVDTSIDESIQAEEPAVKPKGRPAKKTVPKVAPGKENKDSSVFKKPAPKPKAKSKANPLANAEPTGSGRLVDSSGVPLSKDQIDQMSTASTGSRFGRGRQLSVFREFGAEQFGRVGRTGRHHLPPVNFWAGEQVNYDKDGSLVAVYQPEALDEPKKRSGVGRKKGGKRARAGDDDEDDTLEDWETKDGVFGGVYRDYDAATETMLDEHLEGPIAWSEKGIQPNPVASQQFKFCKLATAGDTGFFSWGAIELEKDGIKRAKNSRKMHMVFNVMKGAVEVNVNDNIFAVHKGGIWQVPRGNLYSIRNIAKSDSRIFFAQSFESIVQAED